MPLPATPGRRERKRSKTLDHLAATAFHLFQAYGYDSVTMEQIATEADVAKGTLYNHFPVKEALLAHWIHAELAANLKQLREDIDQRAGFVPRLSSVLDASAKWCRTHRAYLPHYLRFRFLSIDAAIIGDQGAAHSDILHAFEALIADGQRSGELRNDLSPSHLATLFHHLYLGALMRWLTLPGLKLDDEFSSVVELFLKGAGPQPIDGAAR